MPQHDYDDEDMDSILSSIMQGEDTDPDASTHRRSAKKNSQKKAPRPVYEKPFTKETPAPKDQPIKKKHSFRRLRLKKPVKRAVMALLIALAGAAVLFGAYRSLSGPISSLFTPPSPFSSELKEQLGFPVYYPTNLPHGFKLDKDSIIGPENGIVIYVISDSSGKSINITLQAQPEGINLDPLHAALSNLRDVDTPLGQVKVGITTESRVMSNILTGQTWIIVNTPTDTVSDADFDALLKSFKQG